MKLVTRQIKANRSAKEWEFMHGHSFDEDLEAKKIHRRLLALGKTPNPDDVDQIISSKEQIFGKLSTQVACGECGETANEGALQFEGDDGLCGYELVLCPACLKSGLDLISSGGKTGD